MTASRNKASRAVTAALVGVLSVGAVPMVAVAADSGATTLSVTATDALEGGTLTGAVDVDGNSIEIPATGEITFTADGRPQGVYPTEVTVAAGASTVKVDLTDPDNEVVFFSATGSFEQAGMVMENGRNVPTRVGKYVAVLTVGSGDYNGATVSVPFEIKAASLEGVTAVDTLDGSFEFDGTDQLDNIAFELDGKLLYASSDEDDDDAPLYIDQVYKKGSTYADWQQTDSATDAGEYSVVLVGREGTIYAGSQTEVQFTVSALDLSKATIVVNDVLLANATGVEDYKPEIVSINGKSNDTLLDSVTSTFKSGPDGSNLVWKRGEYTYTVTGVDGNANVTGSQDVTFVVADALADDFEYQGKKFSEYDDNSITINLGNGESFTPDKIQAFREDGTELNSGEYTVTATNLLTGEVSSDLSVVSTPGRWAVSAKVNAAAMDYALAGSDTLYVTTISGTVKTSANVYFLYDGKVSNGVEEEYDGTDKLDGLQVVVTDSYGNVLEEGTDYTVTVTDEAGNVLDEVVDAGDYTVTVSSVAYVIDDSDDEENGASITLKVSPLEVQAVRVADSEFFTYVDNGNEAAFLPYTGSAIVPTIEYKGSDGAWHTLPSELFTLTYMYSASYDGQYSKVDDMTAVGYYKVYLHAARDISENWDLKSKADQDSAFWTVGNTYNDDGIVRVSDQKVYADVENNAWYAEVVYEANRMGYMTGYANGTFFGPMDSLSRADAVVVLWKMAGKPAGTPSEGSTSDLVTYDLPYGDIDEGAYYAQALQWATKLGIVAGDGDAQETFRPSANVKREEFAKMLYVYEQLQGNVEGDVDEDAILAAYGDADSVSEWAGEYVAWLVDQGVMGVDTETINGDGDIVRAEVAAMVVRIQPGGQLDGFLTSK